MPDWYVFEDQTGGKRADDGRQADAVGEPREPEAESQAHGPSTSSMTAAPRMMRDSGAVLRSAALLSSLIDEAKTHPTFTFRPGTSARDLVYEGDRVTGLRLSTSAGEETFVKPMLALVPWLMGSDAIQGFIPRAWLRQRRPLRMGIADVHLRV